MRLFLNHVTEHPYKPLRRNCQARPALPASYYRLTIADTFALHQIHELMTASSRPAFQNHCWHHQLVCANYTTIVSSVVPEGVLHTGGKFFRKAAPCHQDSKSGSITSICVTVQYQIYSTACFASFIVHLNAVLRRGVIER